MNGDANTKTAIRRGQRARMDYCYTYALAAGLTAMQAAQVAAECERWFMVGVVMTNDRIAAECELVRIRRAA